MKLNTLAAQATLHCLTGCAIGEVAGMVIGTRYGLSDGATIALAVVLAFIFGYLLSLLPLVRSGIELRRALRLVLAADTLSIFTMEAVDNGVMMLVPGAMDASLSSLLFWGALAFSLFVAFWAAYPVNAWLLSRGRGHALTHAHMHTGHDYAETADSSGHQHHG